MISKEVLFRLERLNELNDNIENKYQALVKHLEKKISRFETEVMIYRIAAMINAIFFIIWWSCK